MDVEGRGCAPPLTSRLKVCFPDCATSVHEDRHSRASVGDAQVCQESYSVGVNEREGQKKRSERP